MSQNPTAQDTSREPLNVHEEEKVKPKVSPIAKPSKIVGTAIVWICLGALAVWGHHSGWKVPKFSELTGPHQTEKADWCNEHSVPESLCVECNPDLLPDLDYGWCKIHGIPNCLLEHPEVAQLKTIPAITATDLRRAERALQFAKRPENSQKCKMYQRRIQFDSKEAVEKAGIDVAPAWESPMVEAVSANGQITYRQTHVARLSSRLPGIAWRVEKQIGERVNAGDVLTLIEAAEVGKAKGEFLLAQAQADLRRENLERLRSAYRKGAEALISLQEAETNLQEAEIRVLSAQHALVNLGLPVSIGDIKGVRAEVMSQRLRFLGLPSALSSKLDAKTTTANLIPLKAPISGFIVSREVVQGELVDSSKVLFVVADMEQMWLTLDLRVEDAKQIAVGQRVMFHPDGNEKEVAGQVAWISTAVDEKTRTVKVRADLDNAAGTLRAFTFGTGRIILREESQAVLVPNEAIQSDGDCQLVFVRDRDYFDKDVAKVFHVRTIRSGARSGPFTEIAAGLLPGEIVATKGSGMLRSELLKNNLGEG